MPSDTPSRLNESAVSYAARNAIIARRLALVLIVVCSAMMLLGPTIADFALAMLGCPGGVDCRGPIVVKIVAARFSAFYRADQFLDVPFIFLVQFWPAILLSLGLILFVRYRKPPRNPRTLLSLLEDWCRRSPIYRWPQFLAWACLGSLISFCALLGTPFVATETARVVLSWLGCEVNPWRIRLPLAAFGSGRSPPACLESGGFWVPRLRDYVSSAEGWFAAPYLLGVHFGWIIIAWAGISALLFGLARLVRWRELG
ncbi:hypothetical protein [Acidovorax sp. BL-A-41-H1]|uniref:hypothetical protein n=1 Tax=Acidovorax sp. BL-A-41-H1 TaxID=3421102 RepID=UPI003F7AFBB4